MPRSSSLSLVSAEELQPDPEPEWAVSVGTAIPEDLEANVGLLAIGGLALAVTTVGAA